MHEQEQQPRPQAAGHDVVVSASSPAVEALEARRLLAAVEAVPAATFVESVGVHAPLTFLNSVNQQGQQVPSAVANNSFVGDAIEYLGIDHMRTGLSPRVGSASHTVYHDRLLELHDRTGVEFAVMWGDHIVQNDQAELNRLADWTAYLGDAVDAVEGPNETDFWPVPFNGVDDWQQATPAFMQAMAATVRGDARINHLPIYQTTLGAPEATDGTGLTRAERLGDLSAHADYANSHAYTVSDRPPGYAIDGYHIKSEAAVVGPGLPLVATEGGYNTHVDGSGNPLSYGVHARYQARLLLEQFVAGFERTYVHTFFDEAPYAFAPGWGLFEYPYDTDSPDTMNTPADPPKLRPKPAATGIRNLLSVLGGDGASTVGGTLDYEISGLPASADSLLLHKGDGVYQLVLWNDADNWDASADGGRGAAVTVADVPVTINFESPIVAIAERRPLDPVLGLGSGLGATTVGRQAISVGVPDHPLVLEIRVADGGPFATGNGVAVAEAEHFHQKINRDDRQWSAVARSAASGGAALLAGPDGGTNRNTGYEQTSPRVDYLVDFPAAGTYQVWVRGRAGGTSVGSSDSLHVGLNGKASTTSDRIHGFGSSFGWSNTTMDSNGRATINVPSAGFHAVSVWMREDGFELDKLAITSDAAWTPGTGAGPAETWRRPTRSPFADGPMSLLSRVQAEDFDRGGAGLAYADSDFGVGGQSYRPGEAVDLETTSDAGGGYNVGWTEAGERLDYSITLPTGRWDLDLRVASAISGGRVRLRLDGVDLGTVDVPYTGGWQSWRTLTLPRVDLAASSSPSAPDGVDRPQGRLLSVEILNGGFNLNWMQARPSPNLLANGDFEDGGVAGYRRGWSDRLTSGNAGTYSESSGNSSKSGSFHVSHYSGNPYRLETVQTVSNLAAGTYRLSGWFRNNGGGGRAFGARLPGGATVAEQLIPDAGSWTRVTMNVTLNSPGSLEVFVRSDVAGGKWQSFDDLELYRI